MTDGRPTDGAETDGTGTDGETADSGTTDGDRTAATDLPTVVSVAGPSGAGKTTLVESLCEAFADRRVATVKSIHHDIEPDTPGTDTHRHRTAGADRVVGVTPSLTFEVARGGKGADRTPPAEAAALRRVLERLAPEHDLVVVEGFTDVQLPTIRVGGGAPPAGAVVGTDGDSIGDLVAAIDALGPFDPATLGGEAGSRDGSGSRDGVGSRDGAGGAGNDGGDQGVGRD
ncbi:molybdopterin-guanine dinucleotide biosynthesis adapter protein MobB [Natronomonas moolapensis 8.8.11]|uniref:Molybdopterin-guanine dinucleotide biosynthesis adapter protein MobB n=1 Tax=Natronomonas moolapensis (strain DSM 18674 / CECT 7526 / JCM 14361 / 8.8.11) TaxID=268739 RepID=M1XQC0_NATM8|nr:molybdopterin-guanine dinucleotide biosynthesis protein B [Natronomonas moolapensis]CCQ36319.1 molybdopterin-guanine dinucleotide biosynthesis adapter protein MobB [Natronomonas moolapensis 8.8.11]